jgi:hypothetical protein
MLCFSVTSSRTYLIRARKGRGGERRCEGEVVLVLQIWCWGWAPGHFLGLPPRFPRTGIRARRLSIFFTPLFNTNFTTFEIITMFEHKAPLDTRCITKEWPPQLRVLRYVQLNRPGPWSPSLPIYIVALHILNGTLMNIRTYPSSSFEFINELISQTSNRVRAELKIPHISPRLGISCHSRSWNRIPVICLLTIVISNILYNIATISLFNTIDREAKELLPRSIFIITRRYKKVEIRQWKGDFWCILTLRYHQNDTPTIHRGSDLWDKGEPCTELCTELYQSFAKAPHEALQKLYSKLCKSSTRRSAQSSARSSRSPIWSSKALLTRSTNILGRFYNRPYNRPYDQSSYDRLYKQLYKRLYDRPYEHPYNQSINRSIAYTNARTNVHINAHTINQSIDQTLYERLYNCLYNQSATD